MRLYFLIVLCRGFVLNAPTKAEENSNTIEIQSARRMEGDKFFPIETHILTGSVVAVEANGDNDNLPADGKTRILMLVGHPGNDKVTFPRVMFRFTFALRKFIVAYPSFLIISPVYVRRGFYNRFSRK